MKVNFLKKIETVKFLRYKVSQQFLCTDYAQCQLLWPTFQKTAYYSFLRILPQSGSVFLYLVDRFCYLQNTKC